MALKVKNRDGASNFKGSNVSLEETDLEIGVNGVGIADLKKSEVTTDGGVNRYRLILTDKREFQLNIRNGSKGTDADIAGAEEAKNAANQAAENANRIVSEAVESVQSINQDENQRKANENARIASEDARNQSETDRNNNEQLRISRENTRGTSENTRLQNERNRQNAESTRQSSETTRNNQEATRQSQETTRQGNETTRQQNEEDRQTNETTRGNNETARINSETGRVNAETGRVNAENERVDSEDQREQNETTRQSNETTRQNNESVRQSNENQRQQTFETSQTQRQTAYTQAETNRNNLYTTEEGKRNKAFEDKEAVRDAANQAALDCADTLAQLGPEIYNIVEEEWGGVLDDATTNGSNTNVFWCKQAPDTKPSHITKIRFKAYYNIDTKLYKVTENDGSATCELIATIPHTASGIYEYEYETDLAENEYIGISSSFYYKNGYNNAYKYSYASASGGTISTTNSGMVGIALINESKTSRIGRLETADAANKDAIKNVEVGTSYKFPTSNIGRINGSGTIVSSDTNWKYSDLMYVKEGFSYVLHSLSSSSVYAVLFYTKDAGFISGIRGTSDGTTPTDLTFTIPDGAYYIRVQSLATDNDAYVINTNTLKYLQNTDEKATDAISRTEFTAGSVDRAKISMSTTSTSSVWFQMAPKIKKVDKIRFIAKTGTTNFFKVDLSAATAVITQIAEVENTSAEDGTIKEVAVNLTLGANEYIGFNNAIRYEAGGMTGFLGGYCSPTGTSIHTNISGFACGFEAVSSVKAVVESLIGTSEKRYYTIDAEGKGDFTNIYEALKATMGKDSASNPITIIVMPGTYETPALAPSEFFSYCSNRYLSIIGTDKVNCILRNDNGYYNSSGSQEGNLGDNSVIKLSGNVYIANLTIIATDTENASETDDYYHRSYCIHADAPVPSGGITEIHNCHLINNHAPCIGFGIYPNATLKITDCELEADFYNPSTTYGGAVIYGHDRGGSTSVIEEHLIIKNCTFVSSNGHAVKIINNNSSLMDASFTSNVCDVPSGKGFVNGATTTLTKLCYGNNVAEMNYSAT